MLRVALLSVTACLQCLPAAATPAPASFDCGMRKLAYSYGKQLLPRQGSFESLYYALNLNDPACPTTLAAPETGMPIEAQGLPADAIYVDATTGKDTNLGNKQAPLKSVKAALAKAGTAGTVMLRDGTHYLDSPLLLGPEHSHLTIRSYPGESPVVSGGKKLDVKWQPENVQGDKNIYKANIAGQVTDVPGLQLNGVRATRARYPNLPGGIEVSPGYGAMVASSKADWTPPDFNKYGKVKFYTDNVPAHRRNDTADDWFHHYMIGVGGLCSVYDPPVGYWCSEHPSGGGAFAFRTPSGVTPKANALPNAPYKDVSQMIFNVWRPARWANWMFEVGKNEDGNFTFGRGGNQGARGENKGGDFFVENIFEELDNPGEFFFDAKTSDLYLFYNGTGAPPADMEVIAPQKKNLINITGTQWNPVMNVTIDGITFKSTAYTYMDPHGVPSAGDWAMDRIAAVFLQGTSGIKVQNSVFERLDGNAVMISGFNRHTIVQGNDFAYIGGNAIVSWGYTNETENSGFPYYSPNTNFPQGGIDGSDGNHPRYNTILSNNAREVGLYEKQSSFYMQAKTAQSTIDGNVFFNGPRAGINFNDGFGGGDVLSHNLVFSTCRESGDHGPFNSWDRQPYLTSVRTGSPSMQMAWRTIRHNFFIDNYSPQENVDNDDGSGYYSTYNNFFVYGGNGMKNDFGGHDNHHFGNIYGYVGQALGVDKTLAGHGDIFMGNRVILTGGNVGSAQCSGVKTTMEANQYFTSSGSVKLCGKSLADAQKDDGMDLHSNVTELPADASILSWATELLQIGGTDAVMELVV